MSESEREERGEREREKEPYHLVHALGAEAGAHEVGDSCNKNKDEIVGIAVRFLREEEEEEDTWTRKFSIEARKRIFEIHNTPLAAIMLDMRTSFGFSLPDKSGEQG